MGQKARTSSNNDGRGYLAAIARQRELAILAERAGCSPEEAARRRSGGERYCSDHGWFRQIRCLVCQSQAQARELATLAERASCSLEEAARRRGNGERFCIEHGWYLQSRCMVCKGRRQRARRAARAAQRRACE